jgi:hypothetical protein
VFDTAAGLPTYHPILSLDKRSLWHGEKQVLRDILNLLTTFRNIGLIVSYEHVLYTFLGEVQNTTLSAYHTIGENQFTMPAN